MSDSTATRPSSDRAEELAEILDRYLADVRAGQAPDRAEVLARHAHLASELEPCLAGIDFIHRAAEPIAPESGELGEFRIIRELGRGGMGVVYEAEQTSLKRRVALKVLRFGVGTDPESLQRFEREAQTVARLHHTNIVPIHAIGSERGVQYFAMQFIAGQSLADVLAGARREGRALDPLDVARWGLQAAEALDHAHQRGVIHRDIKPSNLLLDAEGTLWLTDFGLAKRADEVTLTISGALMGTPRYMSPEQAESLSRAVDHRTDLYSLGATLYELATGRPVFDASTPLGVISQILQDEPSPPRQVRPGLPRDLETIILTCLAKDPAQRYPSARALADDLRALLEGRAIKTRRAAWTERTWRAVRRQKKSIAIAAVATAASVLAVVGSLLGWQAYDGYRKSLLKLKAQGAPQTAQVLRAESDEPVGPEFSVPTLQPVSLDSGSYRLRVSGPNQPSQTYQMLLERGQTHEFALPPIDGLIGKAFPLDEESAEELIQEGGKLPVLEVTPWALRRWDPLSGQRLWEAQFEFRPPLVAPVRTQAFARRRKPPRASLVRPPADLDGDGHLDFVISLREPQAIFAISGQNGTLLWQVPAAEGAARIPQGTPVLADVDADGRTDVLATFDAPKTDEVWAEALSGKTGHSLWKQKLKRTAGSDQVWPLAVVRWNGRTAIAASIASRCRLLDPGTGAVQVEVDLFDPQALDREPTPLSFSPRWSDLDGDGQDDALVVSSRGKRTTFDLTAVSPAKRARLWQAPLTVPGPGPSEPPLPGTAWPVLVDLEGDGHSEILAPHSTMLGGRETTEVRLLDGRTGQDRWRHGLGIGSGPPFPAQFRPDAPRFVPGPDLDGDGLRDLLVASLQWYLRAEPEREGPRGASIFVDALSGSDGRQLWWQEHRISSRGDRMETALCWDNGPNGWPHLVASLFSYSAAPELVLAPLLPGGSMQVVEGVRSPQIGDCDGDGLDDLITVRQKGPLDPREAQVLRGRPREAWSRLGPWAAAADFDGDGLDDLISWRTRSATVHAVSGQDGRLLWSAPVACGVSAEISPRLKAYHVLPGKWKEPWFRGWRPGPALLQVDFDRDGVPDPIVTRWQIAMDRGERGRVLLPLAAISGKTGRQLWAAGKLEIGGAEPLNAEVWGAGACPAPGRDVPDLLALYEVFDVKSNGTIPSWEQLRLARLEGTSGALVWDLALTDRFPFDDARSAVFPHELADLDADGKRELLFHIPSVDSNDHRFEELVAVSLEKGSILWRRTMTENRVEQITERGVTRFEIAHFSGPKAPASVIVIPPAAPEYPMHLLALDGRNGELQWEWWGDGNEEEQPKTVALGLARLANDETPAIIVGQGFAKDRAELVQLEHAGRMVQSRKLLAAEIRLECADVDGDGLDEILFEDGGKLWATRGGLTNVLWSKPVSPLRAVLPPQSWRPATLIAGDTFGLAGPSGERIWRTGPSLSMLENHQAGSNPRLLYRAGEPFSDALVCMIATPVSQDGSYRTPRIPHALRASPSPDPRWLWPLPWSQQAGVPAWLPLKLLGAAALCLGGLVFPISLIARAIHRRSWSLRLLLVLPVSYAVFFAAYRLVLVQLPPGLSENQQRLAMLVVIVAGLPVLAWLRLVGASLVRGVWRRLFVVLILSVVLAAIAGFVWLTVDRGHMAADEHHSWKGWPNIWVAGAYLTGVGWLLGSVGNALRQAIRPRHQPSSRRTAPVQQESVP